MYVSHKGSPTAFLGGNESLELLLCKIIALSLSLGHGRQKRPGDLSRSHKYSHRRRERSERGCALRLCESLTCVGSHN